MPLFSRSCTLTYTARCGACALLLASLGAADTDLSIVPQLTFGTAGFEPGVALEWRINGQQPIVLRPEVFVNEDHRIGGGGSVLLDLTRTINLPEQHSVAIGPRVVHHHADDISWEADALVTWNYDLSDRLAVRRHAVGLLGALGVLHDRRDDQQELGATAGATYSFRF